MDNIFAKDRTDSDIDLAAKDIGNVKFPRNIITAPDGTDITPLTDTQLRASPVAMSAASLPLPTGASTEATLSVLSGKVPAKGAAASAAATPVVLATDDAQVGTKITAATLGAGGSGLIGWLSDIALACKAMVLGAGSAVIGKVGIDQTAPGTSNLVAAGQSGTWTVQPGNTPNTTAWKVDNSGVTQPISAAALPLPTGASTEATLSTLNGKIPAQGPADPASSHPVVLATDVTVTGPSAQSVVNTDLLTGTVSGWYDAANFHSVAIQVIGSAGISSGQIIFEQTNDTTLAAAGNVWPIEEDTTLTPTPNIAAFSIAASARRMFRGQVTARYVRARISTVFAGGTVQAVAVFSQLPYQRLVQTIHQATAANLNVTADTELPAGAALADGTTNPVTPIAGAAAELFNGTTWDRCRNNVNVTMGDTGAKTTTFNGATQTNYNAAGAKIMVLIGTVTGTITTFQIQLQVSPDGGTTWLNVGPASTNFVPASGNTVLFDVYPTNESTAGGTPANLTNGATQSVILNTTLPRTWRLVYTIAGTSPSITLTNAYAAYTL